MIKNYSKEKDGLKEPDQNIIDFILNYSKALHVDINCKGNEYFILN